MDAARGKPMGTSPVLNSRTVSVRRSQRLSCPKSSVERLSWSSARTPVPLSSRPRQAEGNVAGVEQQDRIRAPIAAAELPEIQRGAAQLELRADTRATEQESDGVWATAIGALCNDAQLDSVGLCCHWCVAKPQTQFLLRQQQHGELRLHGFQLERGSNRRESPNPGCRRTPIVHTHGEVGARPDPYLTELPRALERQRSPQPQSP